VIFFQKDSEDALSLCKKEAFKKFGTLSLKDRWFFRLDIPSGLLSNRPRSVQLRPFV